MLAGEDDDEPVITPEIAEELDEIFGGPEPFTSADGQFSVVFPSIPTVTTGESPGPNGMTLPVTLVITELGDTASAVTWIDFDPDEIVFDLDQTVEEVATGVGGSVARSESVTWLDGDARDFTIDGAGEYILRGRTVVVGPRIYTLQGIATTETEAESILQGLIDSFVLNDEPVGDDAGAEAAQAVVGLGSR